MSRMTLTLTYQKFLLCVSSQGQDLYSHQKINTVLIRERLQTLTMTTTPDTKVQPLGRHIANNSYYTDLFKCIICPSSTPHSFISLSASFVHVHSANMFTLQYKHNIEILQIMHIALTLLHCSTVTTVLRLYGFCPGQPGEPVPEETLTHSNLSWSSIPLICFIHLIRSMASYLFNPRA